MTNDEPDSNLHLAISPIPIHHEVVVSTTSSNNPRRKRSKVARFENPKTKSPPRNSSASKREKRPEITMPCSECGKRFWSWKALFGHMRCHPERQWRGINPPLDLLRPRTDLPLTGSSDEDNDVAASLILLANGRPKSETEADIQVQYGHSGFRFECSSCKKVFGSRQALGGHRASHKNVKGCFANGFAVDQAAAVVVEEEEKKMLALELGSQSHKCGICLRIFSSGQALGGHKRCHSENLGISNDPPLTELTTTTTTTVTTQALNYSLDLNLPAPMEDGVSSSSSPMTVDLRLAL